MKPRIKLVDEFHEDLLNRHLDVATSRHVVCGWGSLHNQEVRFSALMHVLKYNGGSIIDYGCGTGDLYSFIVRNYGRVSYTGVDSNERMLEIARKTHDADFIQCGFDEINFKPADFIVASGIFQYWDASSPSYYEHLVKALFLRSLIGLAVNFLVGKRQDNGESNGELHLQPSQVLQLADSISPLWAIDYSYHFGSGDITMALFHKREPPQ